MKLWKTCVTLGEVTKKGSEGSGMSHDTNKLYIKLFKDLSSQFLEAGRTRCLKLNERSGTQFEKN